MSASPGPPANEEPGNASVDHLPSLGEPPHHLLVQAPVPAMDVDGLTATILGLVLFAVATVLAVLFYPDLQRHGNGWWLGVTISGFGLGLVGLAYCLYRRARRRAGRWDRD